MNAKITFFPVGNGDMTLVVMEAGLRVLIDANIRAAADDPDDDTPDAASLLRERLSRDGDRRLYVDTLLVTHPDKDHCTGLRKHFHLGPPDTWSATADKIFIREIWSSPMVFRRASRRNALCDDAKAFNTEARRYRDAGAAVADGDRILILGEDEDGRTDDLDAILVRVGREFSRINGTEDESMTARLLGPLPSDGDDDDETRTDTRAVRSMPRRTRSSSASTPKQRLTSCDKCRSAVPTSSRAGRRRFAKSSGTASLSIRLATGHHSGGKGLALRQ